MGADVEVAADWILLRGGAGSAPGGSDSASSAQSIEILGLLRPSQWANTSREIAQVLNAARLDGPVQPGDFADASQLPAFLPSNPALPRLGET